MALDRCQLMKLSQAELDLLFRNSAPGAIPDGEGRGTALICPGTWRSRILACLVRIFWWQGKVFSVARGMLINRISFLSVKGIRAQVYSSASWVDGKEAVILDYSKTSFVARKVRDEIREVSPGLYLGVVFWGPRKLIDFTVDFQDRGLGRAWEMALRWAVVLLALAAGYLGLRFTRDVPVRYDPIEDHFKYGSTGGERASGIPLAIWKALPELFPEYLPGKGYESLGFVYEPGKELPIGVSRRDYQGLDRVFLNCAVCHVGTVRSSPDGPRHIYTGMPANTVDLEGFQRFLFRCVTDEKFTPERILLAIRDQGSELDWINRQALQYMGVYLMRERLLFVRQRLGFTDREPEFGPGRYDTFNPAKVLLDFPMDKLPRSEWVGVVDFPSIWLQGPRKAGRLQLHWDGNNTSMEERNLSAAFGTGVFPPTVDHASIKRIEDWLLTKEPPPYSDLFPIDPGKAAKGQPIYRRTCAECHGQSGRDFSGARVGKVTPIEAIGTDRHRLDSYTFDLCVNQNTLYAGYPWRFKEFRKTFGYANMPLDGLWLRAPYLHNGSVPTVRDLLEPASKRPVEFYRGCDLYDPRGVGFASTIPEEKGHRFFKFDTRLGGNGNGGHEGDAYGTSLSDDEKDALVEYLKTF